MVSEQEAQHVTHLSGGVGAGESHQRPERDADAHDDLPVVPVAQVTEDRSQEHVAADKHWKQSQISPGCISIIIYIRSRRQQQNDPTQPAVRTLQSVYSHLSAVIQTSRHRSRSNARCRGEHLQEATQFNDGTLIKI